MHVIVYSFIKKDKSTKIPTGLTPDKYTDMDCVLKDNGCGIITPVLEINYGLERAPVNYNYCWIEEFKRYYFVDDWVFVDGLWYGKLTEDYLATWRKDILSSEAYILRSAQKFNGYVSDEMYPMTADIRTISEEIDYPFRIQDGGERPFTNGNFVLGITGFELYKCVGSVVYYVFTEIQMEYLMSTLLSSFDWMDFDWEEAKVFLTEDILKTLFNPMQYITSCVWIPGGVANDRRSNVNHIRFGWWDFECICDILDTAIPDTLIKSIPIPKHPQSSDRGSYLNLEPYAKYQLHVPPYGLVDIPADELAGETELTIEWVFDYMTGQGRIMIANSKRFINIFNVAMGVPIQVGQISSDPIQALQGLTGFVSTQANRVSSTINGAVSSLSMGLLGGRPGGSGGITATSLFTAPLNLINDTVGAVGDIAGALSPTVQTLQGSPTGTLIGFAIESFVRLSGKFGIVADEDKERLGRPYCKKEKIGNFKGFVKTMGASIAIEGNKEEQTMLNTLLDSGVFIE